MDNREIKVVELFGGIGAFTKGLVNLNIPHKIVDYVEYNPNAVKAYNSLNNTNFPPKDVNTYSLPDEKIDILFHGSPCQDFSIIGKGKGGKENSNTRSSLLFKTINIIKEAKSKPRIVVWENVEAVLYQKHREVFFKYIDYLLDLGYVSTFSVLNSINFGVPQHRKRLFCISVIKDEVKEVPNLNNLLHKKMEYIGNYIDKTVDEKYIVKQPSILRKIDEINNDIKAKDFNGRAYIIRNHVKTITTKQMRIPNSGFVDLGNGKYRYLTEKECFLLMGFSKDDYEKIDKAIPTKDGVTSSIKYMLAGNSIVVNVCMEIERELIKCLK